MKFGQYVNYDKVKQKNEEDEKLNKKSKGQVKECCIYNDEEEKFIEHTKILHSVMNYVQKFLESESILDKTELVIVISNLLTTHINQFCKNMIDCQEDNQDGEIVFEKRSRKKSGI